MASWNSIPMEIKTAILQLVDSSVRSSAGYATVCREWQEIFEEKTFKQIQLSQQRLLGFSEIIRGRRRKLINHIWLRVEYPCYDCSRCRTCESKEEEYENSQILGQTIQNLFVILSRWTKPHDLNSKGLTLELCQFSPSDSKHVFKDHNFQHDPYSEHPARFRILADPEDMGPIFQFDMRHGWWGGVRSPSVWDVLDGPIRVSSAPAWSKQFNLPKVDVVTGLLIRQQYYRDFTPDTLSAIFKSLVALEHVMYERPTLTYPLITCLRLEYITRYKGYKHMLSCLPKTLKQLTIYENDKQALRNIYVPVWATWRLGFSLAVKEASKNLEQLSMSYFIEAEHFFRHGSSSSWQWGKLKNIILTSNLLDPDEAPQKVNDLLEAAGTAARNMPKLGTMEIWHGRGNVHGCIFRFCTNDSSSTITWYSTFQIELEDRVIDSWTKTIHQNTRHENLGIKFEVMPMDAMQFPASVLRHLKLKDIVVCPISFRQIQRIGLSQSGI